MQSQGWIRILFAAVTVSGLAWGTLAVAQVRGAYPTAFTRGYQEGYGEGCQDAQTRRPYNFTRTPTYQAADRDYDAQRFPSRENYAFSFRQGYEAGYDDGYNGRAESSRRDVQRNYTYRGKDEIWSSSDHHPRKIEHLDFGMRGTFVIPERTLLYLRLNNTLSTRSSQPGDGFAAQVIQSVYADDVLIIPAGSTVRGTVIGSSAAEGHATMHLWLTTLVMPSDHTYNLNTEAVDLRQGRNSLVHTHGTARSPSGAETEFGKVTIGTGPGAFVGTLVGDSREKMTGAQLKASIGLDAGLVASGYDLDLPQGKEITIRLSRPVELER